MDCLVSVIVPVHNTVEYLPRCIDSIRNQSLKDIEIILVENQSNDGSAALCDEYMSFDSRVKVLHLPVANASILVATAIASNVLVLRVLFSQKSASSFFRESQIILMPR